MLHAGADLAAQRRTPKHRETWGTQRQGQSMGVGSCPMRGVDIGLRGYGHRGVCGILSAVSRQRINGSRCCARTSLRRMRCEGIIGSGKASTGK